MEFRSLLLGLLESRSLLTDSLIHCSLACWSKITARHTVVMSNWFTLYLDSQLLPFKILHSIWKTVFICISTRPSKDLCSRCQYHRSLCYNKIKSSVFRQIFLVFDAAANCCFISSPQVALLIIQFPVVNR